MVVVLVLVPTCEGLVPRKRELLLLLFRGPQNYGDTFFAPCRCVRITRTWARNVRDRCGIPHLAAPSQSDSRLSIIWPSSVPVRRALAAAGLEFNTLYAGR